MGRNGQQGPKNREVRNKGDLEQPLNMQQDEELGEIPPNEHKPEEGRHAENEGDAQHDLP